MATVTPDTRPVPVDDLLEDQKETLKGLAELLCAMADEPYGKARDAGEPWVTVDTTRSHRVVMLSGKRGSGKTSLLLTLQHEWGRARGGEKTVGWAHQLAERALLLPSVDFDPLPPGVPMVDWIIGAFRPVAEWVDGRAGGKDHLKRWQEVSRCASVGWGAEASAGHRDLTESVYDREEQLKRWREVSGVWSGFVDALSAGIGTGRGDGRSPLLVLPIDDCDLQVGRVHEVFHAVRVLHHPRVAFVLTGDLRHAVDMEKIHAWGEMQRAAGGRLDVDESAELDLDADPGQWAMALATSRTEKAVPPGHQLHVRLLSLDATLEWGGGWMRRRLDTVEATPEWRGALRSGEGLSAFLLQIPRGFRGELVRVRALVQLETRRRGNSEGTEDALEAQDDLVRLAADAIGIRTPGGQAPQVRARTRAWRTVAGPPGGATTVVVGTTPTYQIRGRSEAERWVVADGLGVLRHSLATFGGDWSVSREFWSGLQVAWTWWFNGDVGAVFEWPLPIPPLSVPECERLYTMWRKLCDPSATSANEVAFQFVRLCAWLVGGELPPPSPTAPGLQDWRALIDWLRTGEQTAAGERRVGFAHLLRTTLPLLASPERGVPLEIRECILVNTFGRLPAGDASLWVDRLTNARRRSATEALEAFQRAQGEARPGGSAGRGAEPLPSVAPDIALRVITNAPGDPWERLVRAEPWISGPAGELGSLWTRLGSVDSGGRRQFDSALLTARVNPWGVLNLHRLLLGGRPSTWGEQLSRLGVAIEVSPGEFAKVLWRAFLEAARGWEDAGVWRRVIEGPAFVDGALAWGDLASLKVVREEPEDSEGFVDHFGSSGFSETDPMNLGLVKWTVDGLDGRNGPYSQEGLAALLLLIQSTLADHDLPPREMPLDGVWAEFLEGAEGIRLAPPRLTSWFDLDLLFRDVRLQRLAVRKVPETSDPVVRRRWAAAELLTAVSRRARRDRHEPFVRVYEVTRDRVRGELYQAVITGMGNSLPFKAWWTEHRGEFIEWIGLNAAEVLPAGLASDPDPIPGIPTTVDPT